MPTVGSNLSSDLFTFRSNQIELVTFVVLANEYKTKWLMYWGHFVFAPPNVYFCTGLASVAFVGFHAHNFAYDVLFFPQFRAILYAAPVFYGLWATLITLGWNNSTVISIRLYNHVSGCTCSLFLCTGFSYEFSPNIHSAETTRKDLFSSLQAYSVLIYSSEFWPSWIRLGCSAFPIIWMSVVDAC